MQGSSSHFTAGKSSSDIKAKEKIDESISMGFNSDNMSETHDNNFKLKQIEWSAENEKIMVEWCDIAQCYKWMHTKSHDRYSYMHAWFTIPAIILSTFTGTASFAQNNLPENFKVYSPMFIGTVNIMIGILTTIQQYLKISEYNEAHRVSAISWDKFARNIRIELAKSPTERMDAAHFLKMNRQEYDRLMETSPSIMKSVVSEFNNKFSGKEGSEERKRFNELKKPDICDIIVTSNENRHPWYKTSSSSNAIQPPIQPVDAINRVMKDASDINADLMETENEARARLEKESFKALKMKQTRTMNEFVTLFLRQNGRKPLTDEIVEHFKDDVNKEILTQFIEKYSIEEMYSNL